MRDLDDLQARLRAAATRRSEDYEPSPDLPERIDARIRLHRRRRQVVAGGVLSAAAAVVAVVALVGIDRDEDDRVRVVDETTTSITDTSNPNDTTTSTSGATSTTSTSSPDDTTTSTLGTTTTPLPAINAASELTRRGLGPIVAGMTVREAQAAARTTITVGTPNGNCATAQIAGMEDIVTVVVEPSGADPLDGIVRAVAEWVGTSEDGVMVGQSRAELLAALGQPTGTEQGPYPFTDGELLTFEQDGFAYGVLVSNDQILGVQSGDPAWVNSTTGCPQ